MKIKMISAALALFMFFTGCSVFQGRPEQDNIDQARGSYIWMNERLNEEEDARQLDSQFDDQDGDANDNAPDAIDIDRSFPGMNN